MALPSGAVLLCAWQGIVWCVAVYAVAWIDDAKPGLGIQKGGRQVGFESFPEWDSKGFRWDSEVLLSPPASEYHHHRHHHNQQHLSCFRLGEVPYDVWLCPLFVGIM